MKYFSSIIFFFFCIISIYAQEKSRDSVLVDINFRFHDGIFLDFNSVKSNSPIPKSNIITSIDKNSINFYKNLFKQSQISIIDFDGIRRIYNTSDVWGCSNNGRLYIYWQDHLVMIPIIGTISYFVASQKVYEYPYYTDPFSFYSEPTERIETNQYFLYFRTGQIFNYSYKNLDPIFATDEEFYKEWTKLSRRKKRKLLFVYLRKFNIKHPLKLPK